MVSVELTGKDALTHDLREYPERAQRILTRALNRGGNAGRTLMQREIAKDTGMKVGDVRDALVISEANFSRLEYRMSASLKRVPLIDFGATGPEPSRGRGRGVSYKAKGGGRARRPHAFIATMASGHRGVFQRSATKFMLRDPKRQAIFELFGPSIGRVFAKFRALALARAEEMFRTNLDHELSRLKD